MTDLQQDINRAARAKALVDDALLAEAFNTLEAAYIAAWRATPPLDTQAREKLFLAVNVIGKVKEHLQSVIANGKLADAEMQRMTADEARKKRFGIV